MAMPNLPPVPEAADLLAPASAKVNIPWRGWFQAVKDRVESIAAVLGSSLNVPGDLTVGGNASVAGNTSVHALSAGATTVSTLAASGAVSAPSATIANELDVSTTSDGGPAVALGQSASGSYVRLREGQNYFSDYSIRVSSSEFGGQQPAIVVQDWNTQGGLTHALGFYRGTIPSSSSPVYTLGKTSSLVRLQLGENLSGHRWSSAAVQDILFGVGGNSELDANGNIQIGSSVSGNYNRVVLWPSSGPECGYLQRLTTHQTGIGHNLSYTGTYNLDDTATSGWFIKIASAAEGDVIQFLRASAGANPRTPAALITISATGYAQASAGFIAANGTSNGYLAVNGAGSATLSLISLNPSNETTLECNGSYLGIHGAATQTTIGANGAASALTANPVGYVLTKINGVGVVIPYYNQ